ncbi:MAG: MgtC/SapB family protein [Deltaproteobacteria bacterium]|nr:MAG: MgtC/SapB family protein [Deltaproteobacteria bacterium]
MHMVEFGFRLGVAMLAGMAIGFERQWHRKSAGLRTNTLVALGAAMYVSLSIQMTQNSGDVTRIIGQVVTGVGFLGAGIIFKEGFTVHGLTTAATVWCSSAVGCIAGSGHKWMALMGAAVIIFVHVALRPIHLWLKHRGKRTENPTSTSSKKV